MNFLLAILSVNGFIAFFLKMAQYVAQGEIYRDQFLNQLCDENKAWKLLKESNEIKVFCRIVPACSNTENEYVFKSEVILDVAPHKLFTVIDPRGKYRPQWDTLVDKIDVIETTNNKNFVVLHQVSKALMAGIISARDSIDIFCFGKVSDSDDDLYIIAGSIESHPDFPPTSKYIRVFHFSSGYRIYPVSGEPNKSRFVMFLNADLKMNQIASMIAEKAKPTLMIQKVEDLRNWIANVDNINIIDAL